VITIGRASADTTPDITIESTGDEERRAYAALEHSSSIESLITENADKPRNDEATIMRARADPNGGQTDTSSPDGVTPAGKKAEPPPPLLIDHALQRAVQLHRALLALKRI
jgi:hypothetical protein